MWTTENRRRYDRDRLRYPSDLTDEEWKFVEPLIRPAKRWRQAHGRYSRGRERAHVRSVHGLSVARDPEGLAAALDGAWLFRSVELGRHARAHPSRTLHEVSRGDRT